MKFLSVIALVFSLNAQADLMLTDSTTPKANIKSMGDCLKSIDSGLNKDAGQINQANDKIYNCIVAKPEGYAIPTEYFVCTNGAKRIQDNKELKVSALDHCNMNFAETIPCVKGAAKLTDKVKKQKRTRECVEKNYAYFTPEFCTKMLENADLLGDDELKKYCTERHENAPPSVTPSNGRKNRR